jgi:hypothetical protein
MANLNHEELAEIVPTFLPPIPSTETLQELRNDFCNNGKDEFQLQSHQRFLRRVLSPDAPSRNLLMVHGTGVGKTCTAIQVAEEYILRPEFQDKKVMVIASRAVEDNFRTQLFDMSRVYIDEAAKTIGSQQCTGRRYLDMLLRAESEPKNWNNPEVRDRLDRLADRIINEFYEFSGYISFGKLLERLDGTEKDAQEHAAWVRETFNNRLIIIDEAHNIREPGEEGGVKGITRALENVVKIAEGVVLVLLTATPMFDSHEEIIYYMNLFLWNDRKQPFKARIKASDIFYPDASIKAEEVFRTWCQNYVSYVKGESFLTFPYRLPPPHPAGPIEVGFDNIKIVKPIQYLPLVESKAQGYQLEVLTKGRVLDDKKRDALIQPTIAVLPKKFEDVFRRVGKQYDSPILKKENLANVSAKFAKIIDILSRSTGIALVYSNYKRLGAELFAMALEEHGYRPVSGDTLLLNPEPAEGKNKYMLLTGDTPDSELSSLMQIVKSTKNRNGEQVRVVITTPAVSEGVDFRYIRQVHILDPWWNMSRMEQVAGRAMRTCSHSLLPVDEQNCTVYYHVVRTGDNRECFDEYTYRTKVEAKAIKIAKVRKVIAESAMDCPLQNQVNSLPEAWKLVEVVQKRSEKDGDTESAPYKLIDLLAPPFNDAPDVTRCEVKPSPKDDDRERPLSTYLDVRDELLTKLGKLFVDKPIWERDELLAAMKGYAQDVVVYTLQQAISTGYRFTDSFNRSSILESKGDLYALAPTGVPNQTVIERTTEPAITKSVELEAEEETKEPIVPETSEDIVALRSEFPELIKARFSEEVLNGYVFDHELTLDEKRAYLRKYADKLPFANRLFVPETDVIVLGNGVYDPPEELVGSERTAYDKWVTALVDRFLASRDKVFGSVNAKGAFTVSKMSEVDGKMVRNITPEMKRYDPISCGTGANDKATMTKYAKYVDKSGIGIPGGAGSKWCMYVELLAREEHNGVWFTPEELDVLYNNKSARDRFTAVFKGKK